MKLTNKQFADRYLFSLEAREVLAYLTVIKTLISRRQIAAVKQMPDSAGLENIQLMIALLEKYDKLTSSDVSVLTRLVSVKAGIVHNSYTLTATDPILAEDLRASIETHAHLDLEDTQHIGVTLEWDGRIYKRTLKTDLQKMLK